MPYSNVVKLCAAGAGKTYGICNDALSIARTSAQRKRVLVTTFTNNGIDTVHAYITQLNQGIPSGEIVVCTWFQFLLSEFIRPYQSFIVGINEVKGFDFDNIYPKAMKRGKSAVNIAKKGEKDRYLNGHYNIMSNHASELAVYLNEASGGLVVNRIREIYSQIYIDEIQDMAGYDIDLIILLMQSGISITCVGDYKQATYKTNTGKKHKLSVGKHIGGFCDDVEKRGLSVIEKCLATRRFNQSICDFANKLFPDGDAMISSIRTENDSDGVFLIQTNDVKVYFDFYHPTVLKYDSRTETMGWPSYNFGSCKGMTFDRVLIFPNGVLKGYIEKNSALSAPEKYYVGVTRPRHSLVIAVDSFPKKQTTFLKTTLVVGGATIEVMKYIFELPE